MLKFKRVGCIIDNCVGNIYRIKSPSHVVDQFTTCSIHLFKSLSQDRMNFVWLYFTILYYYIIYFVYFCLALNWSCSMAVAFNECWSIVKQVLIVCLSGACHCLNCQSAFYRSDILVFFKCEIFVIQRTFKLNPFVYTYAQHALEKFVYFTMGLFSQCRLHAFYKVNLVEE